MNLRLACCICAMFIAVAAGAADFRVEDGRGGYSISVEGRIRQGDLDTWIRIVKGKGEFPYSTYLGAVSGDSAELMRFGEMYRAAHLSVTAVRDCNTECFIWLVGGVSRTVTTGISVNFSQIEPIKPLNNYLLAMDVSEPVLQSLMESTAEKPVEITQEEFNRDIGERPDGFAQWLFEKCGEMSQQEQEDHKRVQSSSFLEILNFMQSQDPERSDLTPIITKYQQLSVEADRFSEKYKQELINKWLAIRQCRADQVAVDQARLLPAL